MPILPEIEEKVINEAIYKNSVAGDFKGTLLVNKFINDKNFKILILVNSTIAADDQLLDLANHLCLLGYMCFILDTITPTRNVNFVEYNSNQIDQVIDFFKKNQLIYNPLSTIPQPISFGLIGYSSGGEICSYWSEKNPGINIVKGLYTIAPTFLYSYPKMNHPAFIFLGKKDDEGETVSWDRSNVDKIGIISDQGTHHNLFRSNISPSDTKLLESSSKRDYNLQFSILVNSISLFFNLLFNDSSENLAKIIGLLNVKFHGDISILYHREAHRKVIEGTSINNQSQLVLMPWIGKFFSNQTTIVESIHFLDIDRIKGTRSFISDRFLHAGTNKLMNKIPINKIVKATKQYYEYAKMRHSANSPIISSKLNSLVEKIILYLKKSLTLAPINKEIIVNNSDLLFTQFFERHIRKFTNSKIINWDLLKARLLEYDVASVDFLLGIITMRHKLIIDPWRHAAFGRELVWKDYIPHYKIDLQAPIDSNLYEFLSIRIGQNYFSQGGSQGNQVNDHQPVKILFYNLDGKKCHCSTTIEIDYPELRMAKVSESIDIIGIKNYYFKNWITDIGIQCHLSYHLISLPKNEKITSIEFQFKNPSGAIMLSEVAFTN